MTRDVEKKVGTETKLREWIHSAGRLDHYSSRTDETERFLEEDENHFVLYAVDTDIVMCYTSPWVLGRSSNKNSVAYGEIFPPDGEDNHAASAITYTIARYIFFELNNTWPIFQLPAHSHETKSVFAEVAYKASLANDMYHDKVSQLEIAAEKSIDEVLSHSAWRQGTPGHRSILMAFQTENGSKEENVSPADLTVLLDELETLIIERGKSPVEEIRRYLSLLLEGTLISTEDAPALGEGEPDGINEIMAAVSGRGTIHEWVREFEEREFWSQKLRGKTKPKGRRKYKHKGRNVQDDANALAWLSTVNHRLERFGGRMVLITGAQNIIETVGKAGVANEIDPSFGNKYIRHFHSFIPQAFVAMDDDDAEDFFAFRSLVHEKARSPIEKRRITRAIRKTLENDGNSIHELADRWRDYRDRVVLNAAVGAEETESDLSELFRAARRAVTDDQVPPQSVSETLGNLSSKLREDIARYRIELAEEFAGTGVEFLLALGINTARNPPDIRFDSYKNAAKVFRILLSADRLDGLQPPFRELLESIKNDCISKNTGANDLGYLNFLVFAGVFASAGHWSVTAEISGYAVDISKLKPRTKSGSGITGREAYFLKAVATRISARGIADFDSSRKLLRKAISALRKDKIERPDLQISDLRFRAEMLATDVGEWQFTSVNQNLNDHILESLPIALNLIEEARNEKDETVLLQNAVNGLQLVSLYLLHDLKPSGDVVLIESTQSFLKAISEVFNSSAELPEIGLRKTDLIKAYELFAKVLLGHPEAKKDDVIAFFEMLDLKSAITKYDSKRFARLKGLCIELSI